MRRLPSPVSQVRHAVISTPEVIPAPPRPGPDHSAAAAALQRVVDAVGSAPDPEGFVPAVLDIVGGSFTARSCAYFDLHDDATILLRYWHVDGETRTPRQLLEADEGRWEMMRELARGFRAPDDYLGLPTLHPARRTSVLDHAAGTALPQWDAFMRRQGWELALHVPLFVGGVPGAELVIYRGSGERYSPDEVAMAEKLGKLLALAMTASRMAAQAREAAVAREREQAARAQAETLVRVNAGLARRGRLLRAVAEVSQRLLATADPYAVFGEVVAVLAQAAGVDWAGLRINTPPEPDSPRGCGRLLAEWTAPGALRPVGMSSGEPLLRWEEFPDDRFDTWLEGRFTCLGPGPDGEKCNLTLGGLVAELAFPIHVGGAFWGSIGFDHWGGPRPWDESEISVLRTAATLIAGALERARAEEAVRTARDRAAAEHAAELARANRALVEGIDTLVGEADLDHFLVAVLRRVREVSGAWGTHLFRYDPGSRALSLHVTDREDGTWFGPGPGDPPIFGRPVDVDHSGGWAFMLETREMIVTTMDGHESLFWPEVPEWHRRRGFTTVAATALVAAGTPVGVLGLAWRDRADLRATQAELVQTLLAQLTLALRLTSLAAAARDAAVARERERAVQERAAELVRANRVLSGSLARLGEGVDADDFLARILQAITREFQAPSATLWLYDMEALEAHLHLVCEDDRVVAGAESTHPNARHPAPIDLSALSYQRAGIDRRVHVAELDDPVVTPGQRDHRVQAGARMMVGVPLLLGERVLGMISLRISDRREIRQEQREVAQALAHQATLALQLSRLAHEARESAVAQERERAAQARATELARANNALRRSADRLAEQGAAGGLLDGVLQEIARAVGPADTTVYLREPLSGELRLHSFALGHGCVCAHDQARGFWRQYEGLAGAFLERLLATDPELTVFDLRASAADPAWEAERRAMVEMGYSGAMSVVMRAGGEVLGLLTVGLRGRQVMGIEEAELVRSLASQASLVVLLTRLGERAREEARQSAVLEERNRIAREIHDTLAQGLTGIIFGLEGALRGGSEGAEPVRRQVANALDVARQSLAEARRSLWALRPVPLNAEGVEGALRRLVEQHRDGAVEIALEVGGDGEVSLPDAEAELALLRVAQEAVGNAVRHAGARQVTVRLEHAGAQARLTVADDGRGFDPDALPPGQAFGITGMRERAARAGGRIRIDSAPGRGTTVTLRI